MTEEQKLCLKAQGFKEDVKTHNIDVINAVENKLDAYKVGRYEGFIDGYHECQKEHEWHYVKDGLPKESGKYLVCVGGVNGVFVLDFETEYNDFGYWCLQFGENLGVSDTVFETITERNEDKVIAWKEIVLPELPKESE